MNRHATVRILGGKWWVRRIDPHDSRMKWLGSRTFTTWREAYDFADWWVRGGERSQRDYVLARGSEAP